jgi:glucose-1-phosphate thymidylyltransferase
MKVIIPVAGAGTKLRPFTYTQPKALIPMAGKTILGFILDQLMEAGLTDFIIILGHLGNKIEDYIKEKYPDLNCQFVTQLERGGTGHAIALAKDLVAENEEVFIVYGDTICDFDLNKVLESKNSCFGIKKVDDPRNFGVAELDSNNKILHVVEKPIIPKSNLALVGIYKIKESALLFKTIESGLAAPTVQEKYNLTDAIETMLQQGVHFESFVVQNWYDCGRKESLLESNAILLKKIEFASEEIPFFENTIVIHPVSIAIGSDIKNSIIGPNVTIGENVTIHNCIIEDTIIGDFTELQKVVLHSSLIGSDAYIRGHSQSLNIGDNTEIDLK